MIKFIDGDLFESGANVFVNTCNTIGVMGKGIAKEFKRRYPNMFAIYQTACKNGEIQIGKLHIYEHPGGPTIINFPTKKHWRDPSRYEWIEQGLNALCLWLSHRRGGKVALPALGCANGGLDWFRVKGMIEKQLGGLDWDVLVYNPRG